MGEARQPQLCSCCGRRWLSPCNRIVNRFQFFVSLGVQMKLATTTPPTKDGAGPSGSRDKLLNWCWGVRPLSVVGRTLCVLWVRDRSLRSLSSSAGAGRFSLFVRWGVCVYPFLGCSSPQPTPPANYRRGRVSLCRDLSGAHHSPFKKSDFQRRVNVKLTMNVPAEN